MATLTPRKVTVYRVVRATSSNLGNPRYEFKTDGGNFKTVVNAGNAYGLENDFTVGVTLDKEVTLILDGRGNVRDWEV